MGLPSISPNLSSKVFTLFAEDDKISSGTTIVTEEVWSTEIGGTLTTFFTSSVQVSSSGDYYYDVYQSVYTATDAAVQFALAYGNANGSGSYEKFPDISEVGYTPSKAIYSQYANVLLSAGTTRFSLYNGQTTTDFMAIVFQRERVKEVLDPGNWELTVDNGAGAITTFVDTNIGTSESTVAESYYIVSGSITNGVYTSATPIYYGTVYPKFGTLILDARMLSGSASLNITEAEHATAATNNNAKMFNAIKAGASFSARNKQSIASQYYFVRVKNTKYNYSTNPTYTVTATNGSQTWRFSEFITDPVSYITTVGLYDNSYNLLAVAKLSQPIKKTKTTEALIRVCLNF